MKSPAVSVLVPVFNAGTFLPECLDSILAQHFDDFELLISDDASTDGSPAIIEDYARRDPRIRWWRNPGNLGIGGNWNACLRAAQGRYVKYVLQDDKLLDPAVLERLVARLETNPAVSLASTAVQLMDASSRPLRPRCCFPQSGVWDGKQVIVRCLEEQANLLGEPSAVLFRRTQATRGFDERFQQLIDLEMWFHLLEQGDFDYLSEPLCGFRLHPAQHTERNRQSGVSKQEEVLLLEVCCEQPWLKQAALNQPRVQQILASQKYYLRKRHGPRAVKVVRQLDTLLGRRRYAHWWLKHKVSQPFCHLRQWLSKRLPVSS